MLPVLLDFASILLHFAAMIITFCGVTNLKGLILEQRAIISSTVFSVTNNFDALSRRAAIQQASSIFCETEIVGKISKANHF